MAPMWSVVPWEGAVPWEEAVPWKEAVPWGEGAESSGAVLLGHTALALARRTE